MKKLPHKKLMMKIPNIHNLELQKQTYKRSNDDSYLVQMEKIQLKKYFDFQNFFKLKIRPFLLSGRTYGHLTAEGNNHAVVDCILVPFDIKQTT